MKRISYKRRVYTIVNEFQNFEPFYNVRFDKSDEYLLFYFTFRKRNHEIRVKSYKELFDWLCGFYCCSEYLISYDD